LADAGSFVSPRRHFLEPGEARRLAAPARNAPGGACGRILLLITSWWLIGRAALSGHLDHGWLLAWALILLTLVPFHVFGTWLQGFIAINGGLLFKQRLLFGTLRLRPEEIRHKGVGQFLGEVMESEAVELLAVTSGFQGLTAVIELIAAESFSRKA